MNFNSEYEEGAKEEEGGEEEGKEEEDVVMAGDGSIVAHRADPHSYFSAVNEYFVKQSIKSESDIELRSDLEPDSRLLKSNPDPLKMEEDQALDSAIMQRSKSTALSGKKRSIFSKSRRKRRRDGRALASSGAFGGEPDPLAFSTTDSNKLYCYCQKPYADGVFYIQCDNCDEWFHGECANIKEEDVDGLALWFCTACEQLTGKTQIWRRRCAASLYSETAQMTESKLAETFLPFVLPKTCLKFIPDPNLPAITSLSAAAPPEENQYDTTVETQQDSNQTAIEAMDSSIIWNSVSFEIPITGRPGARYCSDTCGISLARYMVQKTIQDNQVPRKSSSHKFKKLKPDPKHQPPFGYDPEALERADLERIQRVRTEEKATKTRIRSLELRALYLERYMDFLDSLAAEDTNICGFDSRIVNEWVDLEFNYPCVTSTSIDNLTLEDLLSTSTLPALVMTLPPTVCSKTGKCALHEGWRELKMEEIDREIDYELQNLEAHHHTLANLIAAIRNRRSESLK